jgi:hypothetical protein
MRKGIRKGQLVELQVFSDENLLHYMRVFLADNDQMPPMQTTADHFQVFPNAIMERMRRLEKAGFLQRNSVNKFMFARGKACE